MAKSAENTGVLEILQGVIDGVKAGTVFGQPIEKDGVTVLPVARISGGGGGGKGQDAGGREAEGAGGGLGLSARPVGVYVIRDGKVSWSPAVDVTRVILGGQLVGVRRAPDPPCPVQDHRPPDGPPRGRPDGPETAVTR